MNHLFADRIAAGRQLATAIAQLQLPDPVVLALPRGGVPVAAEIALALNAPLDLLIVRKIGAPGNPELGIGAIAEGAPEPWVDRESPALATTPPDYIARAVATLRSEIARRRSRYLHDRPPLPVQGRTAIVVDDGLATGSTALAALRALRERHPAYVVLAVPVAPPATAAKLRREVDAFVCLATPPSFDAVGSHYADFHQLNDDEVVAAMARVASEPAHRGSPTTAASAETGQRAP